MHKPSFLGGLVVGAAAVLALTIAVPGVVRSGQEAPRASWRHPRLELRVEREVRVVSGRTDDQVEFLPNEGTPASEEPLGDTRPAEMLTARISSNETAAITALRNLISAQAQFQTGARADENANGIGEYGSFGELSGEAPVRSGSYYQNPPLLSPDYRKVADGQVERDGYVFQMFLPRRGDKRALAERPDGGYEAGVVDADAAEKTWCAYAWPKKKGVTGTRTFFVCQGGDIIATAEGRYSGGLGPGPCAAFEPGSPELVGEAAVEKRGQDRHVWEQAG